MNKLIKSGIFTCILILDAQYSNAQIVPDPYPSDTKVNFVRTWIPLKPEANDQIISTLPVEEVSTTTSYFDGLGRPQQSVVKQSSPLKMDLVTAKVYDEFGRESYQYLPFVSTVPQGSAEVPNDGIFKLSPFQQQAAFYNSSNVNSPINSQGELYFYGYREFEKSPEDRVTKLFEPGNSWMGSRGSTTERSQTEEISNNTLLDNVLIFSIDNIPGSYPVASVDSYTDGELVKNILVDEMGAATIEFIDKEGNLVLKKRQLDINASLGHNGWACTYYVYDNFNRLRFIIPPKALEAYLDGTAIPAFANELCYKYEYDQFDRCIVKLVPGKGVTRFVYDSRDRLTMFQDENLSVSGKWHVRKYDELNRLLNTGLLTDGNSHDYHISQSLLNLTYPSILTSNYELLIENYYENYDWVNSTGTALTATLDPGVISNANYFITSYNTAPFYALPLVKVNSLKGLSTGNKVKILNSNPERFLYELFIYDDNGNLIEKQRTNIAGGKNIETTQYDFSGKALRKLLKHSYVDINPQTHTILTKMEYDHAGRLISTTKSIGSDIGGQVITPLDKTLEKSTYDELGKLKTIKLGNRPNSQNELENLTYDYNIRGWNLGVNRSFVSTNSNTDNYFGYELGYDKAANIVNGSTYANQLYDGNISGTTWKSIGNKEIRMYDFAYDCMNRLINANFNQYTSGSFNKNALIDFSVKIGDGTNYLTAYDIGGNIKRLQHWGLTFNSSERIDDLKYNYISNSNKLLNVIDSENEIHTMLGDFRSSELYTTAIPVKTDATIDFTYDLNGNLSKDYNKDIYVGSTSTNHQDGILYNHLNLPTDIHVRQMGIENYKGHITFVYDAHGNKLQKIVAEALQSPIVTNYIAGLTYADDQLQEISHEAGRARLAYNSSTSAPSFVYDYFIKDHLGNVRTVITEENAPAKIYEAGMEVNQNDLESMFFSKIPETGAEKPLNFDTEADNHKVSKLFSSLSNDKRMGPGIILKVMAGDKFKANVFGWYEPGTEVAPVPGSGMNNILIGLASTLSDGIVGLGKIASPDLFNSGVLDPSLTQFIAQSQNPPGTGVPLAYLNWMVLEEEQFKLVDGNYGALSIPSIGSGGAKQLIQANSGNDISVSRNGYLFVYVSNESQGHAYFDKLRVEHIAGPLVEETHYYPFGLAMAGISSKSSGKVANKYKFNGKELNNKEFSDGTGLELYDFGARSYDAQIGRWLSIDPKADSMASWSPYNYVFNNPFKLRDPDGMAPDNEYKVVMKGGEVIHTEMTGTKGGNTTDYITIVNMDRAPYADGVKTIEVNVRVFSTSGPGNYFDAAQQKKPTPGYREMHGKSTEMWAVETLTGGFFRKGGSALLGIGGKAYTISQVKAALREVYKKLGTGPLPKWKDGKNGSPQHGNETKGYRLDPAHPRHEPGHPESVPHVNWWDATNGTKRGKGLEKGAVPIIKP